MELGNFLRCSVIIWWCELANKINGRVNRRIKFPGYNGEFNWN